MKHILFCAIVKHQWSFRATFFVLLIWGRIDLVSLHPIQASILIARRFINRLSNINSMEVDCVRIQWLPIRSFVKFFLSAMFVQLHNWDALSVRYDLRGSCYTPVQCGVPLTCSHRLDQLFGAFEKNTRINVSMWYSSSNERETHPKLVAFLIVISKMVTSHAIHHGFTKGLTKADGSSLQDSKWIVSVILLTRFNKIAMQAQMAVDKEAISLSRVYSCYSKCSLPLCDV